jgi:hypothetical protein
MNAPLAKAVPHPHIKGAYTVDDPRATDKQLLRLVSKQSAEAIASKLNEQRRNAK